MQHSNENRWLSRERCGMALAIAAVACLSSVIVQWSAHFPEEDAVFEQNLFGDLVDETKDDTSERLPLQQTAVLPELQPLPASLTAKSQSVALAGVEVINNTNGETSTFRPTVRFTEPADAEPSSIRAVSYSSSQERNGGRLSGVIEDEAQVETTSPRSKPGNVVQLGTITFEE